MEAKDKAIALVKKFYVDANTDFNNSKICALILANEIIDDLIDQEKDSLYWHEVKKEIEKL